MRVGTLQPIRVRVGIGRHTVTLQWCILRAAILFGQTQQVHVQALAGRQARQAVQVVQAGRGARRRYRPCVCKGGSRTTRPGAVHFELFGQEVSREASAAARR